MNNFNSILDEAVSLANKKGFLLQRDIDNISNKYDLSLTDYDKLCGRVISFGISVFDDSLTKEQVDLFDDNDVSTRFDYDVVYRRLVELDGSLRPLIRDVKHIFPPQKGEKRKLAKRLIDGDVSVRKRLVEINLRGALRTALNRYDKYKGDITDLVSIACGALVGAVNGYKDAQKSSLGTVIASRIAQGFLRYQLVPNVFEGFTVYLKEKYYEIYPFVQNNSCLECLSFPTCYKLIKKIADEFEWPDKVAKMVLEEYVPYVFFEDFKSETELYDYLDRHAVVSDFAGDNICDEATFSCIGDDLKEAIEELDVKEQDVIKSRHGFEYKKEETLEEIGHVLGLTRERIRQIEKKANEKLRIKLIIKGYKKEDIYNC